MMLSLKALASAGVEGVVVEIWWGVVERNEPRVYDWRGYRELVVMACMCGLKVRAVLAFHQHGTEPDDPNWYVCGNSVIIYCHFRFCFVLDFLCV